MENTGASTQAREIARLPQVAGGVISLLVIIVEQGARVIGLDMYRDTQILPGSDALARTFNRNDRIYGVKKFASANAPGVRPHPVLKEAGRGGFSDVVVDANGTVRRGPVMPATGCS